MSDVCVMRQYVHLWFEEHRIKFQVNRDLHELYGFSVAKSTHFLSKISKLVNGMKYFGVHSQTVNQHFIQSTFSHQIIFSHRESLKKFFMS